MVNTNFIRDLISELQNTKVQVKQKAFNKLDSALNNELAALHELIENSEGVLTWNAIFRAAHRGLVDHAEKLENSSVSVLQYENRIRNYSEPLQKLCNNMKNDKYKGLILESIDEAFSNKACKQYFGPCYVNLLENIVFSPGSDLTKIGHEKWKAILKKIFKMMRSDCQQIEFQSLAKCAKNIVQMGCNFSYLSIELIRIKCFDIIRSLLEIKKDSREKFPLLELSYFCCKNLIVDYRYEVCKFTEDISKHACNAFSVECNEEEKVVLAKLLDLMLISHIPNLESSNADDIKFIPDKKKWEEILHEVQYRIVRELKCASSRYRENVKPEVNQIFAQFAARFCYYMYWDDSVWQNNEPDEPSSSKKLKHNNKLNRILEYIKPCADSLDGFNWKWLIVFAELVTNYPKCIEINDYPEILKLLADCQHMIEYDTQVYAFTKCCYVLLQNEHEFLAAANNIVVNVYEARWPNVSKEAIRVCTATNKNSTISHVLLQLLILFKKCNSREFFEQIIDIFVSDTVVKNDTTLKTLLTILKTFNLDSVPNGKSLSSKMLKYAFVKPSLASLKKIFTIHNQKPSTIVISELAVLCCLSKTDVINFTKKECILKGDQLFEDNWNMTEQTDYKKEISKFVNLIFLKCQKKLIIEDENFLQSSNVCSAPKSISTEIKCIIDQPLFEELFKLTEFRSKIIDENHSLEQIKNYLMDILEYNEMLMRLGTQLLNYQSLNQEKLNNCFIKKKIDYNVQEVERLFTLMKNKCGEVDSKDSYDLLVRLKDMFKNQFHPLICCQIRNFELEHCIEWISAKISHSEDVMEQDFVEHKFGFEEFQNAKYHEKVPYMAVTTLCEYYNYEGRNTDVIISHIADNFEFIIDDNVHLHAMLEIIDIFGKIENPIPEDAITWLMQTAVFNICKAYSYNLYFITQILTRIHHIIKFSKSSASQTTNILKLYGVFSKLCSDKTYSPEIAIHYLHQFKLFHNEFFRLFCDEELVQEMYKAIYDKFLRSEIFEVKLAAIDCFCTIIYSDLEKVTDMKEYVIARKCRRDIIHDFKHLYSTPNEIDVKNYSEDNDNDVNNVAGSLQLFTSIFCANRNVRIFALFELSKLFANFKLTPTAGFEVFGKFLTFLNCEAETLMDKNSIMNLFSKWIQWFDLNTFSWYFTGWRSFDDFTLNNFHLILLALLKNNCDLVDSFVEVVDDDFKVLVTEIIDKCYAYILPIEAGCQNIKYEEKAREMDEKLSSTFNTAEKYQLIAKNSPQIIVNMLENFIDFPKFFEISEFELEIQTDSETLKHDDFERCLNYLGTKFSKNANQNYITYLCINEPKFVQNVFMLQKKKIQCVGLKEQKILYFLQYYILVEKTFEYMENNTIAAKDSVKNYLIREITIYFCFMLEDVSFGLKIREIAAHFLHKYLNFILPMCSNEFKPLLHKITTVLVATTKKCKEDKFATLEKKCFDTLNFLMLQKSSLSDEIAKLDQFPSTEKYRKLFTMQKEIKYNKGDFSLIDEINHFLSLEKRKVEGLQSLREHLSSKKSELKLLFDELSKDNKDKTQSLLHRLLRVLIGYIKNTSEDEERAMEAIKCLGEIGVHSLGTMVFQAEGHQYDSVFKAVGNIKLCQQMICFKALDLIEIMLVHPNVQICDAASQACYHMLESASSEGYGFNPNYRPFMPKKINKIALFYNEPKTNKKPDICSILQEFEYEPYKFVLRKICSNMIVFAGDKTLEYLVANQLSFAENLCPMILQLLLCYNNEKTNEELTNFLNHFFEKCDEYLNYNVRTHEGSIFINKRMIKQMLNFVEIIRIYCMEYSKSIIKNLNYLHIARAARYCDAFFTAVMYCEIWAQHEFETKNVANTISMTNKTLQEVMYTSLSSIGIKYEAALYINPMNNRKLYLQNKNMGLQCLLEPDLSSDEIYQILYDSTLYELQNQLTSNHNTKHGYELLWRLNKWDTIIDTDLEARDDKGLIVYETEFEKYNYLSLKCLKNDDQSGLNLALDKACQTIKQMFFQQSLECTKTLYKFLEMAHRLAQIDDFAEVRFKRIHLSHENMLQKWEVHNQLPLDYEQCERVLSQRNSILNTANIKTGRRTWVPPAMQENMLFIIRKTLESGALNDSFSTIAKARNLEYLTTSNKMEFLLEEAKINIKNNSELAKKCLQIVIDEKDGECDFIMKSTAYRLYGEILSEEYALDYDQIYRKYFTLSAKYLEAYAKKNNRAHLLPNLKEEGISQCSQLVEEDANKIDINIKTASCIYNTMAKYCDREYIMKKSYTESPEFELKKKNLAQNEERAKKLSQNLRAEGDDGKKSYIILNRCIKIDNEDIKNVLEEKKKAVKTAFYNYLRSTIYSADDDVLNVFRIISLMLSNYNNINTLKLNCHELLPKIPSFKFIVALPQLTARLSDKTADGLNRMLMNLLTTCAKEHPHHTLPQILALVNSYADAETEVTNEEPRVLGAKILWKNLRQVESLLPIIKQMEKMSTALIDFAYLTNTALVKSHSLMQLSNLNHVHCPTIDIPVVKNGNYKDVTISIVKWDPEFASVGGINAPKKIKVLCSDGKKRPQLLKGKDDMRQDAIMQQIFGVVNKFLVDNKELQKDHARIKTYKIVPFSRRSGILEWCEDTTTLGAYLMGAHEKYRPNDLPPRECIKIISAADGKSFEEKLQVFNDVCTKIHPVFHHFFYERFKNPGQWFECRFTYTVSVAVNSIIGYILGIGDRHVNNILIEKNTGEVIHIDFGIAFEQGKCLPHPETVPFRLTRDILSPMGVSGCDGVFRKTCERTIDILRQNEKTIMTILEVLLYDPLYTWSIGAKQARNNQLEGEFDSEGDVSVEQDTQAARALQRVNEKLKGIADNSTSYFPTIEGQVQYLIQAATNPMNLSRLFRGWQAYL